MPREWLIQHRAGTLAEWAAAEASGPVLLAGERAYITDLKLDVVGDGVAKVASLGAVGSGTYALKGGGDAICMGDSITSYGGSETMAPSWFNHLCVRSLGRLRWRGSYATGGFKIADLIATHVPQVLAMTPKPGTAFIMIAANDCSENNGVGFNVAAKSADYVSGVLAPLQAAGIRVIPVMVTPNDGANGGAPQITANVDLWNAWLRRYCQANGLLCLDANSPLVDTDGSMQVAFRLGGTDHVHPSARGHKAIAEYNLPAVQSAFPPAPLGSSKWAESYNLLGNGTFATDSNSDGLADGWAVGGSPTGFTRSLVAPTAGADINGNWQQVTRATTDTNAAWIYKQISSGWSVGDVLEYSVRVQAEGFTGSGASFSTYIKPGNLADAYGAVNSWTEDIVDGLLTVRFSVPATATTLFCYVANLTVPTSGTTEFRVAEATVRNLTTMGLAAL